jgi:hypothetical protein
MSRIPAAAVLAHLTFSPAYAANDECTDAHTEQMVGMIAEMSDAEKQKEATTHLDQSRAAMKAGDMDGCMEHMNEAHEAMGLY